MSTNKVLEARTDRPVIGTKRAVTHSVECKVLDKSLVESMLTEKRVRAVEDPERVMRFIASTERVDRSGDIVRQNWDLGAFQANPVILWNHDQDKPLGRSIREEVVTDESDPDFQRLKGPYLAIYVEFMTKELSDEADRVYNQYKRGFLKGGSVGYVPVEIDECYDERKRLELGMGDAGVIFMRSALAEFTLCTVPANSDALSTEMRAAAKKDLVTKDSAPVPVIAKDSASDARNLYARLVDEASGEADGTVLDVLDDLGYALENDAWEDAASLAREVQEAGVGSDTIASLITAIEEVQTELQPAAAEPTAAPETTVTKEDDPEAGSPGSTDEEVSTTSPEDTINLPPAAVECIADVEDCLVELSEVADTRMKDTLRRLFMSFAQFEKEVGIDPIALPQGMVDVAEPAAGDPSRPPLGSGEASARKITRRNFAERLAKRRTDESLYANLLLETARNLKA